MRSKSELCKKVIQYLIVCFMLITFIIFLNVILFEPRPSNFILVSMFFYEILIISFGGFFLYYNNKVTYNVFKNFQNHELLKQKRLIEKLYRESLQCNKNITDFFADITHELKTPISVILGSIHLMNMMIEKNKTTENEKMVKYISIMRQNSCRLIKLINSLLQINKINSGCLELNLMNSDIINISKQICFSVSEYIKHKNINFKFNSNIDKKVIAIDPDKLERIFLNLLSNAAKFTPKGGNIIVTVSALKDEVVISIKDTGTGIPQEKLKTIFDRFKQVHNSVIDNHEGCGIGLSLVKSLVELMEGHIEVFSKVGKGTEFKIYLKDRLISEPNMAQHESHPYSINDRIIDSIHVEFSEIYPLN